MGAEEKLSKNGYEDVVYLTDDEYDDALVGVDVHGRAVYDYYKMIKWLEKEWGFDELDAIDWIERNTIRELPYIDSQTGGKAPIIMYPIE